MQKISRFHSVDDCKVLCLRQHWTGYMMTAVKNIPCQHHDTNGATDEGETQWMSPTAMEKCTVHCDVLRHAAYDMTIKVEFKTRKHQKRKKT